jgi:hypothetical protein
MANLTQTPANVGVGDLRSKIRPVTGGEAITQGMPVRESAGKWYQCDANVQAESQATAFAQTACSGDGASFIISEGPGCRVNLGATLVVGETYVVSRTKGAICPIGDLVAGDYPCILGVAVTTSFIVSSFFYSGAMK